jgi:hypothetical protein
MKPSFPLFLLAGVLLVIMCAFQIAVILNPSLTLPSPEIGPLGFDRMVETHPVTRHRQKERAMVAQQKLGVMPDVEHILKAYDPASVSAAIEPGYLTQQFDIPVESFNPLIGRGGSAAQIIIFTDIDCEQCRNRLRAFLDQVDLYRDASRFVLKFLPSEADEFRGGIFMQMAWQGGVFQPFFAMVLSHKNKLTPGDYVNYLEKAGLDLAAQRVMMSERMSLMIRDLQKDIHLAASVKVRRPNGYFLNGKRLGTKTYPLEKAEAYILSVLSGQDF